MSVVLHEPDRSPVKPILVLLVPLVLAATPGHGLAGTTIVGNGPAEVYVGAGYSNSSVDTIKFSVAGDQVGSGTAVAGMENGTQASSLIDSSARAPVSGSRTAVWSVDSSQPLICATPATCGSTTIPMTKFRWTVSGGTEISAGAFNGTASQTLASYPNSRYVSVYKTYYYNNDEIVPAGQYTGRVVYTISMP